MLGYKVVEYGDKYLIITLEIPEDALTDFGRSDVVHKETATYRSNKVKVLKIEDSEGKLYGSAENGFYEGKRRTFKVGEMTEEIPYMVERDIHSTNEIYFFLEKWVAEYYWIKNGIFKGFHYNGVQTAETSRVNGKRHGLCRCWYPTGEIMSECSYKNGLLHGEHISWNKEGQTMWSITYANGVI